MTWVVAFEASYWAVVVDLRKTNFSVILCGRFPRFNYRKHYLISEVEEEVVAAVFVVELDAIEESAVEFD